MTSDPGPLTPIDVDGFAFLVVPQPFVDLTNAHIADVLPHHMALDAAHETIAAASDPSAFDSDTGGALGEAEGAHGANSGAFDTADPGDVIAAANAHSDAVDGHRADYNDTPPPEQQIPDPGPQPGGDGGGSGPPLI